MSKSVLVEENIATETLQNLSVVEGGSSDQGRDTHDPLYERVGPGVDWLPCWPVRAVRSHGYGYGHHQHDLHSHEDGVRAAPGHLLLYYGDCRRVRSLGFSVH